MNVDLDEDSLEPLLLLGAILCAVFDTGIYLVYEAPAILTEAAFEFLIASGMIRRFRKMDDPDWLGSVFRMTWFPFVVVLLITIICSWYLCGFR